MNEFGLIEKCESCQRDDMTFEKVVTDDTILQNTNRDEFVIVTKDILFALNALIAGFKIIYSDDKEQDNFLQATELPDSFINDFKALKL